MNELDRAIADLSKVAAGKSPAETMSEVMGQAISSAGSGLDQSILTLAGQVEEFRRIAQAQGDAVAENTEAILQSTVAQTGQGAAAVAGGIASTALKTLGRGLSLVPLVTSLVGLFRDKKQETTATLEKHTAPESIQFAGAASQPAELRIPAIDYGQDGMPRLIQSMAPPGMGQERETAGLPATGPSYAPSITVQVQAMDSRSFLDHSDEIAQAVREAILNSHRLGDVVGEI